MNTKDIIEKVNAELTAKGFTSIFLTKNTIGEKSIDVYVNFVRDNKNGLYPPQLKRLKSLGNVFICRPRRKDIMDIDYTILHFIIDLAEKYKDIEFILHVMDDSCFNFFKECKMKQNK